MKRHLILGHHLVAFLDVLGQRDRFKGLRLPTNANEEGQVTEVLRQTAGFVLDLRRVFRKQFEVFEKGAGMRRYTKEPIRPRFVGFSDSFVTSVPLRTQGNDLARIVTVFSAMSATAIVMITSLASKHPLRGGIDVGLATEIGSGEIYGTALERAYLLEHEVAQYPRIVIGDELWKYLNSVLSQFQTGQSPVAKSITAITQKFLGFVAKDADGKRILDYLGSVVVENSVAEHKDNVIRPAYEFVLSEQNRMLEEGNAKLIDRYSSLRNYFESRLPLWGLPVSKS